MDDRTFTGLRWDDIRTQINAWQGWSDKVNLRENGQKTQVTNAWPRRGHPCLSRTGAQSGSQNTRMPLGQQGLPHLRSGREGPHPERPAGRLSLVRTGQSLWRPTAGSAGLPRESRPTGSSSASPEPMPRAAWPTTGFESSSTVPRFTCSWLWACQVHAPSWLYSLEQQRGQSNRALASLAQGQLVARDGTLAVGAPRPAGRALRADLHQLRPLCSGSLRRGSWRQPSLCVEAAKL